MRFEIDLEGVHKRTHLPHWDAHHAIHAITFNLYDAFPAARIADLRNELNAARERLIDRRGELSPADVRTIRRRMVALQQSLLDAGHGCAFMKESHVAEIVASSLLYFDGSRYDVYAWCVMPNHVHVVAAPKPGETVERLVHSWKGFSAKAANRLLGRSGAFWQTDYFDRTIRSDEHLRRAVDYVVGNPAKAGLRKWRFVGMNAEKLAAV